jgi:thioredoxin-like negative regulator of GroEL
MQVSDANYKEVLTGGRHVILMWRTGCPACERLRPELHEVARQRRGVWFTMLSSLDNPKFRTEYAVDRCPTLLLFEDGKLQRRIVGVHPSSDVLKWLDGGGDLTSKDVDCEFCAAVRSRLQPYLPQRIMKWIESYA